MNEELLNSSSKEMTSDNSPEQQISTSRKQRTRNDKALLINWKEAQDLLRPAPNSKQNIEIIDGVEVEAYDVCPILAKKTIFCDCSSGEKEQWAQCDECLKWRRLPENVILPLIWTCSENVWDASRSSCSIPEEPTPQEIEDLPLKEAFKKRRIAEKSDSTEEDQTHQRYDMDKSATNHLEKEESQDKSQHEENEANGDDKQVDM